MLQIATAQVSGNSRIPKTETVNVIFDSGSQRSFINDDLRKRLKLPVITKEKIVIKTKIAKNRTEFSFKRLYTDPRLLQSHDNVIKEYLSYGLHQAEQLFVTNVK